MSSAVQNQDQNPQEQPQTNTNLTNPADYELPARYRQADTVACMLFSEYCDEAKEAIKKVQEKAKEWFGGKSSHEDSGRLFDMSMTLYLTPAQRTELEELVKGTPLEVSTVEDFSKAVEQGISGAEPRVDGTDVRRHLSAIECGINAGHAMAELAADPALAWEKQRPLVFDIWNGMIRVHNFAASMLQNVQTDVTGELIARAEAAKALPEQANIFEVSRNGIYTEAARLTGEYAHESAHIKDVVDATLPLARALLNQTSPMVKEVVLSQLESNFDLLGRGLGLYGADTQPMMQCLDDWKAFWDTQVPLLSRYFQETAAEKAQAKAAAESGSSEEKVESEWRCNGRWQGDKVALTAYKWAETVFHELKHEHLWGMRLMGVPGPIGDRAFEVISGVIASANAEAEACRPAYGQSLVEREMGQFPDLDTVPAEHRAFYEKHIARVTQKKMEEAGQLVHGVTDLMLSGLPWRLPRKDTPLPVDPALHLERTMGLLEQAMAQGATSPGLADTARIASQELAIQLNHWDHVAVLDAQPQLAARAKALFEKAKVYLPDEWCAGLRERGILPPAKPEAEAVGE